MTDLNNKEFAITLTTKNDSADKVNTLKLSELNSIPFTYNAEITDEFEEHKNPTDAKLILKEGAQVIFIKNDNERRWINGTIGQVYELTDITIKIKLKDGTIHSVEKREWENIKYQYNKEKKKIEQDIRGTFSQYPLKLAWAITIHKSQGLTFERVVIDFGDGTFASGQAYVALSRATTFKGLYLKRKLRANDIIIDKEIVEFAKTFNNNDLIKEEPPKSEVVIISRISVTEYCQKHNTENLEVFTSKKTGKDYAVTTTGEFVGLISVNFDEKLPAYVYTVKENKTGETWDFIDNARKYNNDN